MKSRDPRPPQLGFNNNVKYAGRIFHIQTEDSGVNHPHITTHLFADGGRILKSERSDYSELLGTDELGEIVRQRMKEQHKAMFLALRRGELDPLIDAAFDIGPRARPGAASNGRRSAAGAAASGAAAGNGAAGAVAAGVSNGRRATAGAVAVAVSNGHRVAAGGTPELAPAPSGAAHESKPAASSDAGARSGATTAPQQAARAAAVTSGEPAGVAAAAQPSPRATAAVSVEAARAGAEQGSGVELSSGAEAAVRSEDAACDDDPNVRSSVRVALGQTTPLPTSHPSSSGRYHATRPAAIFNATGPSSLFGAEPDPIDEQSLDDVILSYISEDLDTTGSE